MSTSAESRRTRRPEHTLLRPTLLGLLRLRWLNQMSRADTEVPWRGKRIDLAFLSPQPEIGAVAIELKVDGTGRAITQAALNRYVTDSSWVATWTSPSRRLLDHAAVEGVGMLLIASRGVYPLLYPRRGAPHTDALSEYLSACPSRVRDLLSELRHG